MKVYLFLDEDGFCEGWGSNEEENSIPIEAEEEVLNGIRKYRYENGELIYDETKALIDAKESRKYKLKKSMSEKLSEGFIIDLEDDKFIYPYNNDNKAYLNKVYELSTSGLIDSATFDFLDKDGNEVTMEVSKINITELWLLSFLYEENIKKLQAKELEKIEKAKSLKEIQEISLDKNE